MPTPVSGTPASATPRPSSRSSTRHFVAQGRPVDDLDGLTVDLGEWWFNVRPSNTEPLLRLNVEANDPGSCAKHVGEVEALIRRADHGD